MPASKKAPPSEARELLEGNKTVSSREEMICPECFHYSVERHPKADEFSSKHNKIIDGSTCTNPNCRLSGDPLPQLERQYSGSARSLKQLALYGVGIMTLAFVVYVVLFTGLLSPTETVGGQISAPQADQDLGTVTVSLDGSEQTSSDGSFSFEEIRQGEHTIEVDSENYRDMTVDITVSDGIEVTSEYIPTQNASVTESGLQLQLPTQSTISNTFTVNGSAEETLRLYDDNNAEEVYVTATPLEQDALQSEDSHTIPLGEQTTIEEYGNIRSDISVEASAEATSQERTTVLQTDSANQAIVNFEGTIEPTDVSVSVPDSVGTITSESQVTFSGESPQTFMIDGELNSDPIVTLTGANVDTPQRDTGVYNPEQDELTFTVPEGSAPSTATLTLYGDLSENEVTEEGTLNAESNTVPINPSGSSTPTEANITFSGGDAQTTTIGSGSVTASAEGGETEETTTLGTAPSNGTYTINYDFNLEQNPALMSYGYSINGNRTQLSQISGTEQISVAEGDEVSLWLQAEQENPPTTSHTTENFEVSNLQLQSSNLDIGDSTGVRVDVTNTANSEVTEEIVIYRNGEQYETVERTLGAGQTQQITLPRQEFTEEGIYSLQVNTVSETVSVGNVSIEYGEGSLEGEFIETEESGTIRVDTNGDEEFDCNVDSNGGSCELDLSVDGTELSIQQLNVSNTNYTVSYVERTGPENVTADLTGNGSNDITISGQFTEGSESATASFPEGTHTVDINTGNNQPVEYELEWTESGVIQNPNLTINGEPIDTPSEIQGSEDIVVSRSNFVEGENTIRLESSDGLEHSATVESEVEGIGTYPTLQVNNSDVCTSQDFASDACTISSSELSSQSNSFNFNTQNRETEFEFELSYISRTVAEDLLLQVNNETVETFSRGGASNTSLDGSWSSSTTLSRTQISPGDTISVSTNSSTDDVTANVDVSFTRERETANNPHIELTNSETDETTTVPITEGELTEEIEVTISPDNLQRGQTTLVFTSSNSGSYQVEVVGSQDQ